jgi:FkbM family methyltransferase
MVPLSSLLRHAGRVPEVIVAMRETQTLRGVMTRCLEIGAPSYPYDIVLSDGSLLRVGCTDEVKVFWEVFVRRCYRSWSDCRTIIDAGANVGIFSLWAAKQIPRARIIALEPFPDTFAALRHNILANHFEDRIQTIQMGLAAQSGERFMDPGENGSPQVAMLPQDENRAAKNVIPVACFSLGDLLKQYDLTGVDLLKMDIQGSEWEVLLSTPRSTLQLIRRIQVEYHEVNERFGYTPEQLFAHLASAGYELTDRHEDKHRTGIAVLERKHRLI